MNDFKNQNQNWMSWHSDFSSLANGDFPSRNTRILSEFFPKFVFKREARNFSNIRNCKGNQPIEHKELNFIKIPPINSEIKSALFMRNWLQNHLKNDLVCALLHGSLGSEEIINYSDFDALVIIRKAVIDDFERLSHVALKLHQARKYMYMQDALQHHGWFVLPEDALLAWDEFYFPLDILRNARNLLSQNYLTLKISTSNLSSESHTGLEKILNLIERQAQHGKCLTNLYQLKSFISKILLVPALMVQAKTGFGVFKKASFPLGQEIMHPDAWSVIEVATEIRANWSKVELMGPKSLVLRPGILGSSFRRLMYPKIKDDVKDQVSKQIIDRLPVFLSSAIAPLE